jgi:hypothetical protein
MKKQFSFGIGILFILFSFFLWPNTAKPKIYDCFLFFNELELLDIRLHELYPYVDHFVIVEAKETFRGKDKPLYFAENKERFAAFQDKIIHVVVEERIETQDPWEREHFQREQVMRGLKDCRKNDVILISDLDEIVKGACVAEIVKKISSGKAQALVCEQKMYYGFLNHYQMQWPGTIGTSYGKLKQMTVLQARRLRNGKPRKLRRAGIRQFIKLKDAGWHFTSMGGLQNWITKVESYSHLSKSARLEWRDGEEFFCNLNSTSRVPIDASFPLYISEYQEHFRKIGFISQQDVRFRQ